LKAQQKKLRNYCLQFESSEPLVFRMLECSKDWEPSHEVDVNFANVPLPPDAADDRIDDLAREFLTTRQRYEYRARQHPRSGRWIVEYRWGNRGQFVKNKIDYLNRNQDASIEGKLRPGD
jgi:hypothetical protein